MAISAPSAVRLRAIAAMSLNRVIGSNGAIPWHLPDDFRWFKGMTLGHAVIMGRKTFESLGRPLPQRRNIVLSRQDVSHVDGIEYAHSPESALSMLGDDAGWVIGGAEIYQLLLPLCTDLYLTIVPRFVRGDVVFPEFEDRFRLTGIAHETPDFRVHHYQNLF